MTGLDLWFTALGKKALPFPSFGEGFISDYSRADYTHRLHIRDAFRAGIIGYVEQCETLGYQLVNFQFAIDREDPVPESVPAFEIAYQDFAFFEDLAEHSWQGNEHKSIEIHDGAAIVEAANQYIFLEEIAQTLATIRPDFQWQQVTAIDKFNRRFWRLIPNPEHSFISRIPLIDGTEVFDWVAAEAELPDVLFFDTIAVGPQSAFHPLIASRAIALQLERIYSGFPLTPILAANSETGKAVIRICEMLKTRIRRLQS